MVYEHLRQWSTELEPGCRANLNLWDTGRTVNGKSELQYALAILVEDPHGSPSLTIIEGEDFHPSPLHAIDSDETAAALLSFMAYYGETSDEEATAGLTPDELEVLRAHNEVLAMWAYELEHHEGDDDA